MFGGGAGSSAPGEAPLGAQQTRRNSASTFPASRRCQSFKRAAAWYATGPSGIGSACRRRLTTAGATRAMAGAKRTKDNRLVTTPTTRDASPALVDKKWARRTLGSAELRRKRAQYASKCVSGSGIGNGGASASTYHDAEMTRREARQRSSAFATRSSISPSFIMRETEAVTWPLPSTTTTVGSSLTRNAFPT